MRAVVFGSRMRMMTAENLCSNGKGHQAQRQECLTGIPFSCECVPGMALARDADSTFGLYSALRACRATLFRSSFTPRLTVATMFCS